MKGLSLFVCLLASGVLNAQVCGTTVYDTGGPSGNYSNNEDYVITYCPNNPGDILTFDITTWNLRAQDVLTIYDGQDIGAPVVATFTNGSGDPAPIASTHSSGCITIQFQSNQSQTQAGWAANITCATPPPPPPSCGTTVYDPGGVSGNYPNNANVTYTYCPSVAGQVVTIDFTMVDTQAGVDILEIYNGPNTLAPLIGTLSGVGDPSPITSTHASGCITVRFTSNNSNNAAGWAANITCAAPPAPGSVCGTTVFDPGGSGNYLNNTNSTVTYCPSVAGEVVTLNFSVFATEANFDQLRIYNGNSAAAPLLGTYSGNTSPGTITSSAANGCLTLVFTSDASVTYAGWVASVTCAPPPPPPSGDCIYVLNMYDNWGDGWGASNVTVCVYPGGASPPSCNTYTVTGSFNQVTFGVNINDIVSLNYNNSGTFQGDNRYTLGISTGGGALFNSGNPPTGGLSYIAPVTCIPPPLPPEDCAGGVTVCNSQGFNNNSNNTGSIVDLNSSNYGCLLNAERQGTWYNFSPSATGNIGFSIDPTNPADDYDFAIWGPFPPGSSLSTICPPLGPPTRCSYAAPSGSTGMNFTATDNSEGATGDKWVNDLAITVVGEVYLLYISNWSQSGLAFSLNWNLINGASLDCTVLPVTMIGLKAEPVGDEVLVTWSTLSEEGSERFLVERAGADQEFGVIGMVPASGYSNHAINYRTWDSSPLSGMNYYRLRQVDLDGSEHFSDVVSVNRRSSIGLAMHPVPATDRLTLNWTRSEDARFRAQIMDASGRMIREQALPGTSEAQSHSISLNGLDAGSYLLQVVDDSGRVLGMGRFVKH